MEQLDRRDDDPPVFVGVMPPFSADWIARAEAFGAVAAGEELKDRLEEVEVSDRRSLAWELARQSAAEAKEAGCSGVILMGLRFSTVVTEGHEEWNGQVS